MQVFTAWSCHKTLSEYTCNNFLNRLKKLMAIQTHWLEAYSSFWWYEATWETFHFEEVWLCKKISLLIPQNLILRSVTVRNVSQIVYSYWGLFFLHGHIRSRFSVISQKHYHLLKWNLHRLVLLYTSTFFCLLKISGRGQH